MIPLAAVGPILTGVGAIMGGLGMGRDKPPSPEHQSAVSLSHERASFAQKMAMAKEHGLHPLSVLGVPGTSFSPVYQSGGGGFDAGAIGAGLGSIFGQDEKKHQGVEPEQHPAPVEDALESQRRRLFDAQIRRAEADANLAELQVYHGLETLRGQAGRAPGQVVSNDVNAMRLKAAQQAGVPLSLFGDGGGRGGKAPIEIEQKITPPHPNRLGFAAGTDQAWINLQDRGGQAAVINPQAVNADIERGATFNALAKEYGVERAMQITAVLENEGLLIATGVGTGWLLRHPVGRAAKWLAGLASRRIPYTKWSKPGYKPHKSRVDEIPR